jgi:hypothetical protein
MLGGKEKDAQNLLVVHRLPRFKVKDNDDDDGDRKREARRDQAVLRFTLQFKFISCMQIKIG